MTTSDNSTSSNLSKLYGLWVEDLLGGPTPQETRATCSDCAMLRRQDDSEDERHIFFNPQTKCCTYMPVFPNFLVGMILRDNSPEMATGRESVERRLAAQVAVTPLGIDQPQSYRVLYDRTTDGFGRSRLLRCPHYIEAGGLCGVWRYRSAICSTFFCKHDRGAIGFRFWRKSLEDLLKNIERALSRWCLLELGIAGTALEHVLESDDGTGIAESELEGRVKPATYRAVWERWAGKERQFYEDCAARVDGLRWSDIEHIGGPTVRLLARKTQEVYTHLNRTTHEPALRCGSFKIVSMRPGIACISSYSDYDPIEVPSRLLGSLQHFDGQPTAEAIATIADREKVNLDAELVRKLSDFALLVPAKDEDKLSDPVQ